jgi:hypothetical protein
MHEEETVNHLTAVEIRKEHFGKERLTLEDYINLLNGKISWSKHAEFCKVTYKYKSVL